MVGSEDCPLPLSVIPDPIGDPGFCFFVKKTTLDPRVRKDDRKRKARMVD